MAEKKQLVLLVEGSSAMGPYWRTIVSDYLEKLIRSFCGDKDTKPESPIVELALVMFHTHGSSSPCLVMRGNWTSNVELFFEWLSGMQLGGRDFSEAATAEGLDEVLLMFPFPNRSQIDQENEGFRRHCILVAASDPYPVPTPVAGPPRRAYETQSKKRLADAKTLAKSFPQSCISLSVICPREFPRLKAIYNAGKRNPNSAMDHVIDIAENPYLFLISETFMEARATLNPSLISTNKSPPKTHVSSKKNVGILNNLSKLRLKGISGNPNLSKIITGGKAESATLGQGTTAHVAEAIIKDAVDCMLSGQQLQEMQSLLAMNTMYEYDPSVMSNQQLQRMQSLDDVAMNMMNDDVAPSAMSSDQQLQGIQSLAVNDDAATHVGPTQQTSNAIQSEEPPRFLKIRWRGHLYIEQGDEFAFISRLQWTRTFSAPLWLPDDWPHAMIINRLIPKEHVKIKNKKYIGEIDNLDFEALDENKYLENVQVMKLTLVIMLLSKTLLLTHVSDHKTNQLVGTIFPRAGNDDFTTTAGISASFINSTF